jgi:hypothetical protein
MRESGFVELVGPANFAEDIFGALDIAKNHLNRAAVDEPGAAN